MFENVQLFKTKKEFDFNKLSDRRSIWFKFQNQLYKGTFQARFLKNNEFLRQFPGKIRIFSQNIFIQLLTEFTAEKEIAPIDIKKSLIINQLIMPKLEDFPECPPELFKQLRFYFKGYQPDL